MKAKILERILIQAQKQFRFKEIKHVKVFDKQNYEYLKGRHSAKHVIVDGTKITIVEYSPDPREYLFYENSFEYLDEFLLAYFSNNFLTFQYYSGFKKSV
ncbi:hypothetical protein SAMN05421749_10589 [Acinetobacter marinus]|uniref:Uncharacterized protein n=1 Tax=Acinetobacter marinus TaxID=281375 RepID=A0A1G6LJE9_9GAMM|nr:hypothetical protein SAMN05421749_10589 [Acinetobacter marinus]